MWRKLGRFIWNNLIAGIVIIMPAAATFFIIKFLVVKLNSIMLNPLLSRLRPYLAEEGHRIFFAKFTIFLSVIIIIVLIGIMARVIFIRRAFSFLEKFLYRLPMISNIYGVAKEVSRAFLGPKQNVFQKVVLVEYPRKGIYSLGFITSDVKGALQELAGDDLTNVYIPTSPNPTTGLFVLIKKEDLLPVNLSVEDALKVIISAGTILPPKKGEKNNGYTEVGSGASV